MALRFGKNIQPRQFNYQARWYDAEKEELERRLAKVDASKEKGVEAMKLRISDGMRNTSMVNKEWKKKLTRQSNYRLIIVLMILLIITCVLFFMYYPLILSLAE